MSLATLLNILTSLYPYQFCKFADYLGFLNFSYLQLRTAISSLLIISEIIKFSFSSYDFKYQTHDFLIKLFFHYSFVFLFFCFFNLPQRCGNIAKKFQFPRTGVWFGREINSVSPSISRNLAVSTLCSSFPGL